MSSSITTSNDQDMLNSTEGQHHHHRGRRLRHLILPSGRKVHVAPSPEEAENLRKRLAAIEKNDTFDLVISGSPEHIDALRTVRNHHENRRDALKQQHGEVFDEFENVRQELDILSSELHNLTDHAVALDASFNKYGFSAHLRTYDDQSPVNSSASSISGFHDPDHEKKDWEAERRNGRVMKLYKTPVVRQYFHKGLLWRASGLTEVASFELFVDLLFVGILAINGDHVGEAPDANEVHRFVVTFIMAWKIWSDLALIISWFETDDLLQRVSVLVIISALMGLTVNMLDAFHHSYMMLVAFYSAARIFMATYCFILAMIVPMVRGMMIAQSLMALLPITLWLGSIHVELPQRYAVIWTAIFLDHCSPMLLLLLIRNGKRLSTHLSTWFDKVFEFYPAMNIEHRTERTNAFVGLVFGYSVVAIMYQNAAHYGLNAFFGKAVLGLVQAFCFNWIYFELDGAELYQHAIRRNITSAMLWSSIHLPFIMAYVLAAGALSKMVVCTDVEGLDPHDLTHFYENKSEDHVPDGLRWFYCVGLGIALACMGVISLSHVHKDITTMRIRKCYRLLNRFGISIVMICLPTAHDLNSLQLISITTGMVVYVLCVELWGTTCVGDTLLGGGGSTKKCKYVARCKISKQDLENAAKQGTTIKVEEFSESAEKGAYH